MLDVFMDIGGKHYAFRASSAVSGQFGDFLYALYGMYDEEPGAPGEKRYYRKHGVEIKHNFDDNTVKTHFCWDSEGHISTFDLKRRYDDCSFPDCNKEDNIEITIDEEDTFVVDARDLCYAVAKASTVAMKKYGIYGYHLTCGANCNGYGDSIDIERLLFVKAYALNAMEVRKTTDLRENPRYPKDRLYCATFSPFEKEMELLLFDM